MMDLLTICPEILPAGAMTIKVLMTARSLMNLISYGLPMTDF